MIYAIGLGTPIKKAFRDKARSTNLRQVISELPMSPEVSKMDALVLCSKDLSGLNGKSLRPALEHRHPDICVIYLYTKSEDAGLVDIDGVHVEKVDKYKPDIIEAAVNKFLEGDIATRVVEVKSKDTIASESPLAGFFSKKKQPKVDEKSDQDTTVKEVAAAVQQPELNMPEEIFIPQQDDHDQFLQALQAQGGTQQQAQSQQGIQTQQQQAQSQANQPGVQGQQFVQDQASMQQQSTNQFGQQPQVQTQYEQVAQSGVQPQAQFQQSPIKVEKTPKRYIEDYMDHNTLVQKLSMETAVKEAFATSNEIVGLASNLALKDDEIRTVFQDKRLSTEERIRRISEIGIIRAEYKGEYNRIIVSKINSIINTCTVNLTELVDDKIDKVNQSIAELYAAKDMMEDTRVLTDLQQRVIKTEYELMEAIAALVKTYTAMDDLVVDEIKSLATGLPSENEFINNMLAGGQVGLFTPSNTSTLATELMKSLQENRITMSSVEDRVNEVLKCLRNLFKSYKDIVEYQDNMIKMLKAHRVEDYVICDTMLKSCLRLYVGTQDTGLTSTTLTWCGILSRRHNTLVVDLTGHNKFRRYGVEPILLENFLSNPVKEDLVFVESSKLSTEDLYEALDKLKMQVHYYPFINIILDAEDKDNINALAEEALSVTYITDCSEKSIEAIKESNHSLTVENVARKLVTIDTPINPLEIMKLLDIDFTNTKVIPIPNLTEMRRCALMHTKPYESSEVVRIFEEAFR